MLRVSGKADVSSRMEVTDHPNRAMRTIDPAIVAEMERCLRGRKSEHIMEVLGISLNTWNKVLLGGPVRASLARRLIDRFDSQIRQSN
jgi:hypothetical protein